MLRSVGTGTTVWQITKYTKLGNPLVDWNRNSEWGTLKGTSVIPNNVHQKDLAFPIIFLTCLIENKYAAKSYVWRYVRRKKRKKNGIK